MRNKSLSIKINLITLGSVFVLILVGSIVRSLGAGMGCPDWPKCFGSYIPPTSDAQLPDNYLDIFRDQRLKKNARLASTLNGLGFSELGEKITNDPMVLTEQEFDVTKAWIEYINRLVGVVIGLLVFLNMIFSFRYWKVHRKVTVFAILIFVLTGFQGWVGSLVVSTNLLHGFITFHMLLALLIVALLIAQYVSMKELPKVQHKRLFWLSVGTLLLFIPQLILGTEVRGVIDDVIASNVERSSWSDQLDTLSFYIHRSYSWLLLIGAVVLFALARKETNEAIINPSKQLVVLVFLAMLAGIGMAQLDFPFWLQPLHLIFATGIFSLLFYLTLRLKIS